MGNFLYVIFGIIIMFSSFFLTSWGITALYFVVSHEKVDWLRDVKISLSLATAGLLSSLFLMITASSGSIYLYIAISTIFSGLIYGILLKYVWKFSYFDASINSFTLAFILNLGWLQLLGII